MYKGESFDLWTPDTGIYYAFANPEPAQEWLQGKRLRAGRSRRDTAHGEFSAAYLRNRRTLPCHAPRVAFRDVSRAPIPERTGRAVCRPKVFVTNKGPYFLWPRGRREEMRPICLAFCRPFHWTGTRGDSWRIKVVNFFIINPFPIPRPESRRRTVATSG